MLDTKKPTKEIMAPTWKESVIQQYPWMQGTLETDSAVSLDARDEAPHAAVCDEDIEEAFQVLEEHHDRINADGDDDVQVVDFAVAVQGGSWSMKKHGRACDSFKGRVRLGSDAAVWCDKYVGARSAQYDAQLSGDHTASVLAREWCRRLLYFWNLHRNAGDPHYVFTGVEIAAYRPLPAFTAVLPGLPGRALQRARELNSDPEF